MALLHAFLEGQQPSGPTRDPTLLCVHTGRLRRALSQGDPMSGCEAAGGTAPATTAPPLRHLQRPPPIYLNNERLSLWCPGRTECVGRRTAASKTGSLGAEVEPQEEFTHGLGLRQTQGQTTGDGSSLMSDTGRCRSPLTAVGLEDLRLDDLVTGTAHHEVEVVVCWVVAKQVHICGGKENRLF